MKICLLTRRFALDSGGIGRVGTEIRDGLGRLGHEVHTVSTDKEDLVSYFKHTFLDIKRKIPKGMDIYHAITPMESIYLPKEKSVSTILDIIPITNPDKHGARMGSSKLKYTIGKICFNFGCKQAAKCSKIVCISEHVIGEFIKHYGVEEDKIGVIRLGIREDLEPKDEKHGKFRIGYLGQLDRRKRVDLLVKAFKESDIAGELVLGGKGTNEEEIKQLASYDNRIKFLSFVPDNELADFYNSLDVLVFPTMIEGYGLPPVEAMACKVPTVVLSDAIIPWEVKSRCIIVEDLDIVFGNMDYLKGLIRHIDYDSNYKWAKEHSWDRCVEEYIKLYEEVLNG